MLLAHLIGQHRGFAAAVQDGDAPRAAYAYADDADGLSDLCLAWENSVERLLGAFARADLEMPVRLVEIDPARRIMLADVVRIHLLDTVVHTWDLGLALGREFMPDDEVVPAVVAGAARVPADGREAPGSAFAAAVEYTGSDLWAAALARLGRRAGNGDRTFRTSPTRLGRT